MAEKSKDRGRPPRVIPPIKDTPERVARATMQAPPKKEWDYMKENPKTSHS
ncbi:MAG: hypothetical protein V6Z81_04025 [Parvularculales bacterium]